MLYPRVQEITPGDGRHTIHEAMVHSIGGAAFLGDGIGNPEAPAAEFVPRVNGKPAPLLNPEVVQPVADAGGGSVSTPTAEAA